VGFEFFRFEADLAKGGSGLDRSSANVSYSMAIRADIDPANLAERLVSPMKM
jgi:hypothetical protein